MKLLKKNAISIITLILLICFAAAGVNYYNRLTELYLSLPDGGDVVNVTENSITVNAEQSNVSCAAAKGLRSAVSVYCTFTATVGSTNPWNPYPTEQTYYSAGSGVIYSVDEDGNAFVITNHHVVYDADCNTDNHVSEKIYLYLYGRESEEYAIEAYYVGGSENYDIAVLRVDNSKILADAYSDGACGAITVGDSDAVLPGDTAIAIGNPSSSSELGGISVTSGIVSVDSEYITMTSSDEKSEITYRVIRVDTPINSGNSGGGLFNGEGELIGIVNAKINSTDIENIGYAIPSSIVRAAADNIIDNCYLEENESVMRCLLGITVSSESLDTYYDTETGALVKTEAVSIYEISSDSIAKSKLSVGDVITELKIGDKTVTVSRRHQLIDAMLDARVGDEIVFTVLRNGETVTASITVDESCITKY